MATRQPESITRRKARHIEVCLTSPDSIVGSDAGFDEIDFIHSAAPELDRDAVDLSGEFFGRRVGLPIFISCMTGGSEEGFRVNRNLARAAAKARIPVGLGSIRVLHRHPELFEQFHIRPLAGEAPVIANLGGVQVRDLPLEWITETLKRLEVDLLAVHLNPGQELFQDGGDRDFRGVLGAFARLSEASPVPLVVKETGFGISPATAAEFINRGAAAIDTAGAGGTNWLLVESVQAEAPRRAAGENFRNWGIPTAAAVAALHDIPVPILASGGIRSPLDAAKALALGAASVGMALPFIKAESEGRVDAVTALIDEFRTGILDVMTLTGADGPDRLRSVPLLLSPGFRDTVRQLRSGGGWRDFFV